MTRAKEVPLSRDVAVGRGRLPAARMPSGRKNPDVTPLRFDAACRDQADDLRQGFALGLKDARGKRFGGVVI